MKFSNVLEKLSTRADTITLQGPSYTWRNSAHCSSKDIRNISKTFISKHLGEVASFDIRGAIVHRHTDKWMVN